MEQFYEGLLIIAVKEKYSMHCIVNTPSAHEKLITCIARQILHGYPEYQDAEKSSLMKENSHLVACAALTMIIETAGHRSLYMKNRLRYSLSPSTSGSSSISSTWQNWQPEHKKA